MEQSSFSEANQFSASQLIPHILWNLHIQVPTTCPYGKITTYSLNIS